MWYMYSDLEGKGVALGLTPARMLKFIHSISEVFPFVDGKPLWDKPLVKDVDFEMQVGWVAYQNPREPYNFHLKGKWYDNVSPIADFMKDNYFIKLYPWYYEDEFRILIKLKEETKYQRLFCKIPDVKFKLLCGPGMTDVENEDLQILTSLLDNKRILKCSDLSTLKDCAECPKSKSKACQKSCLKINMNLIHRNMGAILHYIEKIDHERYQK